jgi:pre-rRNA-processing protein TSR2
LTLAGWPALSLAIQNSWGGPESSQKRDWFAGALSDLVATTPSADLDSAYVEEFLLQVMQDEFEVVVDDGSAAEIAELLLERRQRVMTGDGAEVERLMEAWREKQRNGGERIKAQIIEEEREDDDDDDDESEGDDEEWNPQWEGADVDMAEAPALVQGQEHQRDRNPMPEVDEEGFTKVVGRRR